MNKQDKKSQRIADNQFRKDAQRVEQLKLGGDIAQIAKSLDKSLGPYSVRKVLACKILMGSYELSITEWCDLAEIARGTWYNVHAKPGFGEACVGVAKTIFGPRAIEVTQALVRKALRGSQDGLGDVTAQTKILQQVEVVDREDSGFVRYSDDELRRITRTALGIIADESADSDSGESRITKAS